MKKIQPATEFLPDEVWSHIISFLAADLESLSFVSKRFLSITNSFNQTLKLSPESAPFLPSLLRRFSSIKRISLSDFKTRDLYPVLLQLAEFRIRLEALNLSGLSRFPLEALHCSPASFLNGVKCLDISGISGLGDEHLNTIPLLFPALEELDLSFPISHEVGHTYGYGNGVITDNGIEMLIPKLNTCLRKINLSGHPHLSRSRSLILLSQNCPNLEEIVVNGSSYMNEIGIVVSSFKKLRSIGFRGMQYGDEDIEDAEINYDLPFPFPLPLPPLPLPQCWASPSLSKIEFDSVCVSGDLLRAIAEDRPPLKSFTLANSIPGYCFADVAFFMNTYDSLEYLDLKGSQFCDGEMAILAKYLTKARVVKLTGCPYLTVSTLFTLIQNCPLLHTFEMDEV